MNPRVISENKYLLVLNKPSGWVVNEAETTKGQKVIQQWLKNMTYPLAKAHKLRSGIVHRLDKETSGIVVVAKTKKALKNLQAQFKARKVKKTYIALVHGKIEPKKSSIKVPVGRLPWNRERFGVLPGGRSAFTEYKVIKYYNLQPKTYTLVEFYPRTGRTHQIRVHAKYIGHPVVSDKFYAGRKTAKSDRQWCPRLFLHASKLSFKSPSTGKNVSFETDLPSDLKKALKTLD